ncbi:hypothetical protein EYF80_004949 [Liparis tanakae]|uniref:Uncharacterized protein n=1 Tax=Liparis tanakae TaxID=230148 RepID=A0A4Z2J4T5_9TELE|nr:hypothetical protein EYF80_004949 [Liparis tanakae]
MFANHRAGSRSGFDPIYTLRAAITTSVVKEKHFRMKTDAQCVCTPSCNTTSSLPCGKCYPQDLHWPAYDPSGTDGGNHGAFSLTAPQPGFSGGKQSEAKEKRIRERR